LTANFGHRQQQPWQTGSDPPEDGDSFSDKAHLICTENRLQCFFNLFPKYTSIPRISNFERGKLKPTGFWLMDFRRFMKSSFEAVLTSVLFLQTAQTLIFCPILTVSLCGFLVFWATKTPRHSPLSNFALFA